MAESEYAFDPAWEQERERLAALEEVFDDGTIRHIAALGDATGWHCLEVGGGGGSIASWLCRHVGPAGQVVATDMDTRFLERLDHPNLQVLRHDVTADPLADRSFDLIHARAVLEHVPARDEVVARLVAALRPGGWLLLEDVDLSAVPHVPPEAWFVLPEARRELFTSAIRAIRDVVNAVGADLDYGARLPGVLASHGLVDVDAELHSRLVRGGTPRADYPRLTIELLRPALEERLGREELDEVLRLHRDPATAWMSVPMVAAWGRRPGRLEPVP